MFRRRWIISVIVLLTATWVGVIAAAKYLQHRLNDDAAMSVDSPVVTSSPVLPVLWKAPTFSYVDQDGKPFTEAALRGHAYIADFIFTQCTTACPIMTARMRMLQRALPDPSLRFVSFSVDPAHDTPAALTAYRTLWRGDTTRWTLLSTTPAGLAHTAADMRVAVQKGSDPENPILHSSLFILVDGGGNVRGVYDSIDDVALDKLKTDVRELDGEKSATVSIATNDAAQTPAARGEHLFGTMGCLACHSRSTVAPPLIGLAGNAVRLTDRKVVWADDAYLHESIVNPGAKIVAGYLPSMPAYGQSLSPEQVNDLIAYLHTIGSSSETGHGEMLRASTQPDVELVRDPVCHMSVRADPIGPQATYNRKIYHFCSDTCRERFLADPSKFAAK